MTHYVHRKIPYIPHDLESARDEDKILIATFEEDGKPIMTSYVIENQEKIASIPEQIVYRTTLDSSFEEIINFYAWREEVTYKGEKVFYVENGEGYYVEYNVDYASNPIGTKVWLGEERYLYHNIGTHSEVYATDANDQHESFEQVHEFDL